MATPLITPSRRRSGFTLIEVTAVLVIVAVLCVLVMAGWTRTPAQVVAEAGILRSHLRFSQGMAMANNTATWSVMISGGSYTLLKDGQPSPINLPDETSPTHTLSGGVRIVGGTGVHEFCEWGCPGVNTVITLSDGRHQEHVRILGFTGLIQ